jgi:VWFA-related protein
VPGLKKDMFKVLEDGVAQNVTQFTQQADAPITAVLLVEFANNNYLWDFMINSLEASYSFAQSLKKDDWIAVIAYDMRPEILADFTQDKRAVYAALSRLRPQTAGFSETNLFDALYDTIDRLQGVEGRKYIVLVSSGCDSFSKINYDKVRKKVESAKDIVVYAVSTGQAIRLWADANNMMRYLPCTQGGMPAMGPMGEATTRVDFLQADNQMNTFARMTGGRAYFPRFEAEFPEIFQDIASSIRNEYVLAYKPSNSKQDGSFRKLKVELLGPDGKPLKMKDEKGKDVKYQIIAREGYTAKHEVE